MIQPIKVKLRRSELAQAEQAAVLRYLNNRSWGVEDKLIDTGRAGSEAELPGIKAEIAAAKLLNAPYDASTQGTDSGCDLFIDCGDIELGVQVKSTHHTNAKYMLGTPHAKWHWDVSVFVRPTEDESVVEVYGWIPLGEYKEKLQDLELGHGPTKGVSIDDLRSMEELWRFINVKRSS
jgi:hypothetical protein